MLQFQLDGYFEEVSGIAVSTQTFNGDQMAWVHDDSGGLKAVGLYNLRTGVLLHIFHLPKSIKFEDVEDIALGDCGASWPLAGSGECIYLADTGDNDAVSRNNDYQILKFREPVIESNIVVGGRTNLTIEEIQVLRFQYDTNIGAPTSRTDCEALFVDSAGLGAGEEKGDVYLVSKWKQMADWDKIRIFRYPNSQQDNATLIAVEVVGNATSLRVTQWTKADLSRDGNLLVIGGYSMDRFWHRSNGSTLKDMWNTPGSDCAASTLYPVIGIELQQEAAAFTSTEPYELVEIGECATLPCNATMLRSVLVAPVMAPTPAPTTPAQPSSGASLSLCAVSLLLWIL